MKNKKSVLICFAILALLCLGIGFATLVDELYIEGNLLSTGVSSDEFNEELFDIQFTDKSATKSGSTGITVDVDTDYLCSDDTCEFKVFDMKVQGDKVVITYTIKNVVCPDGYKANVVINDNFQAAVQNNAVFTKKVYFVDTLNPGNTSLTEVTLAKNDTATIKVEIELTKTLAIATDRFELGGMITLKATAVAAA